MRSTLLAANFSTNGVNAQLPSAQAPANHPAFNLPGTPMPRPVLTLALASLLTSTAIAQAPTPPVAPLPQPGQAEPLVGRAGAPDEEPGIE